LRFYQALLCTLFHTEILVCELLALKRLSTGDCGDYVTLLSISTSEVKSLWCYTNIIVVVVIFLSYYFLSCYFSFSFSALTLLVGRQEGHPAYKN